LRVSARLQRGWGPLSSARYCAHRGLIGGRRDTVTLPYADCGDADDAQQCAARGGMILLSRAAQAPGIRQSGVPGSSGGQPTYDRRGSRFCAQRSCAARVSAMYAAAMSKMPKHRGAVQRGFYLSGRPDKPPHLDHLPKKRVPGKKAPGTLDRGGIVCTTNALPLRYAKNPSILRESFWGRIVTSAEGVKPR